jgi:CTP synthase
VIDKERRGDYWAQPCKSCRTVIDEIKMRMMELASSGKYDVVITEIGGTVGDIESQPFLGSHASAQTSSSDRKNANGTFI